MGGSSYWVTLNKGSGNTDLLAETALHNGIFIEPGNVYFQEDDDMSSFRLGFSSIPIERIDPGIEKLARLA